MRKILFRGVDEGGAWRHGFYVCLDEEIHAIYTGGAEHDCGALYPVWYEVDPRTVGEYSGYKDSNGVRIFEGDVIKFRVGSLKTERRAVIEYKDGAFQARCGKTEVMLLSNVRNYSKGATEIIGNVHDAPGLLAEVLG